MQDAVTELLRLGRMPSSDEASIETVERWEQLLGHLVEPAGDDDARALVTVLPLDGDSVFGLAWSVIHFVETAPGWPLLAALDEPGEWITSLRQRAVNGGLL